MLTAEDKEDIRRIVTETVFAKLADPGIEERKRTGEIEHFERLLNLAVQIHDLIAKEGFTDLTFVNPSTGETRVAQIKSQTKPIVEATARAMEVFGSREKALRWLNTPLRSLGDRTPLSRVRHHPCRNHSGLRRSFADAHANDVFQDSSPQGRG